MKYSVEELGRRTKAQYPQYAGMTDGEVGTKVVAKYPQYGAKTEKIQGLQNWASNIPGLKQIQDAGLAVGSTIGQTGLGLGQAALKVGSYVGNKMNNILPGSVDTSFNDNLVKQMEDLKYGMFKKPAETNLATTSGKVGTTATNIGMYFAGGSGPVGGMGRLASAGLRGVPDMLVNAGQGGSPGSVAATGVASSFANAIIPKPARTALGTIGKNLFTGGASGEVSDIGMGLAGLRGDDRKGVASVIPGGGFITGLSLGALQSIPAMKEVYKTGFGSSMRDTLNVDASSIMNRVARINPSDARTFEKIAGTDHGTYLTQRGIFGDDQQIMEQLARRFEQSKGVADTQIGQLPGNWKNDAVTTMLDDLAVRDAQVSTKGAPSLEKSSIDTLLAKNKQGGLTMEEINAVKRMYERNVKLDYLKTNNPTGVARATAVDSAVRTWQYDQASKLGFENLQEINKETQLARQLGDSLWKKYSGQTGNNALGLTDAILIAGGDPAAIATLIAKKTLGTKGFQSWVAKRLSGDPTVGAPTAQLRGPITDQTRLLPDASFTPMGAPRPTPDTSNVRAVPAQNAQPERLRLNAGAIPMGAPKGESSVRMIPATADQPLGQATPQSPVKTETITLPTVKQGTQPASSPLSTAARQGESSSKSSTRPVSVAKEELRKLTEYVKTLEDDLSNSPAKALVNKMGRGDNSLAQLQENAILRGSTKKNINRYNDIDELGFKDLDDAQAGVEQYLKDKEQLTQYKQGIKTLRKEISAGTDVETYDTGAYTSHLTPDEEAEMMLRLTRERGAAGTPSDEWLLASAKRELAKTPNDAKLKSFVAEKELMVEARKYKTTVNINDKDDVDYLRRILSDDNINDIKNGKMTNWRGTPYEDMARVNIVSETPKTAAQKLEGKIKDYKLKSDTFYHGTSKESAQNIITSGFKRGAELPENAYRGGGYGKKQDSISFAETPKDASRFSQITRDGAIIESRLKKDARVVAIDGVEDAIDLNEYVDYLKKQNVDAVWIGGGEKELVVINPRAVSSNRAHTQQTSDAMNIIDSRYAKGDISKSTYNKAMKGEGASRPYTWDRIKKAILPGDTPNKEGGMIRNPLYKQPTPTQVAESLTAQQIKDIRAVADAGIPKAGIGDTKRTLLVKMFKRMDIEYPRDPKEFQDFLVDIVDIAEKKGIYKRIPVLPSIH